MNSRLTLISMLAATLLAIEAHAESLIEGSVDAGKARSITCTACHGADGNSANPLWPNIAGQSATYIVSQLQAFKSGDRTDPLMAPQAMMLSDDDIANLAVYYESLPAPAQAVSDASSVAKGEALYRGGDSENGVAACLACHGPTGRGNPAANYPAIQGQHAAYTEKQLRDYASGARTTDGATRIMRDIAERLDADDVKAVASYIQGLRQ